MIRLIYILLLLSPFSLCFSQPVPNIDENIPYLITFGNKAEKSWGDDDYTQILFFLIPENYKSPVYIRVFDPDIGGSIDENNEDFDTKTRFSVYGGKDCYTNPDAQNIDPVGNYKSGSLLATKIFANNSEYDNNWYTFGPFNPTEGEYIEKYGGNILKIIIEGIDGNDGNLYRFFLSTMPNENKAIEGANAFAYEYSFRLYDNPNQVSHIYPYIDDRTISIKQSNFDWDNDGYIRVVSVLRKGELVKISGDNTWAESEFKIYPEEKNTSLDIQLIKNKSKAIANNNVVIYVKNQYDEFVKFYTVPIGGVPKPKFNIAVKKK